MFTGDDKLVSVKSQGNLINNNNNNSSKVLMVKQVIRENTKNAPNFLKPSSTYLEVLYVIEYVLFYI